MGEILSLLKDEKGSITTFGALLIACYIGFVWAGDEHKDFVTRQDAEQSTTELKSLIRGNANTADKLLRKLDEHTRDFESMVEESRIEWAANAIRDVTRDIRLAQNDNTTTEREMNHLHEELAQAKRYYDCLVNRDPNCTHMKPPSG